MSRSGRRRRSARIATACSRATSPARSSMRCAARRRRRPALGRTLHGRWDVARGVGESQELPPQGRGADAAARRSRQSHGEFPRGIAAERHPSVHDRSRRPARAQGAGQRSEALLRGPCAARQSTRVGRQCLRDGGDRHGRTRGGRCCCWARSRTAAPSAATRVSTSRSFVAGVRALAITPHVAQKASKAARIDGRTTRHAGYAISQRKRKLIEQVFGWMKTVGGLRKLRHRGGARVDWIVTFTAAAYNLIRLRTSWRGRHDSGRRPVPCSKTTDERSVRPPASTHRELKILSRVTFS